MTTMAVALDRNLFLAYYSSEAHITVLNVYASSGIYRGVMNFKKVCKQLLFVFSTCVRFCGVIFRCETHGKCTYVAEDIFIALTTKLTVAFTLAHPHDDAK